MNWYCLHTRPLKEVHVESYCRSTLGLETYFPRIKQHRTIRRVRRVVVSPLFPRYLFVRFDPASSYRAARYCPEVINIIHNGSAPAIVDDVLIQDLKDWADTELDKLSLRPALRPGDPVQIVGGPMQGVSAVILRASNEQDRVTILLSILHGAQLTLSRAQIERIPAFA